MIYFYLPYPVSDIIIQQIFLYYKYLYQILAYLFWYYQITSQPIQSLYILHTCFQDLDYLITVKDLIAAV